MSWTFADLAIVRDSILSMILAQLNFRGVRTQGGVGTTVFFIVLHDEVVGDDLEWTIWG